MCFKALGTLFLILRLFGTAAADGAGQDSARLLVMLEVPGSAPEAKLGISSFRLVRESASEDLELLCPLWVTHERTPRQTRIVDQAIAPGPIKSLEIELSSIIAPAGAAPVSPPLPEKPLRIELDQHARKGGAVLVVLRWTPHWVDDDSTAYEVRIQSVTPRVPPVGDLAFVSNEGSDLITVLDTANWEVVDAIGVLRGPREMVYSSREQKLYCALAGSEEVIAIDVLSRQTAARVQTLFGDEPSRLILDRDETTLYVLNVGSNSVAAYGSYSLRERFRFEVGQGAHALAYDARTGFIYVSSELGGGVLVYDPVSQNEVARFSVDAVPGELEIDSVDQRLYVGTVSRRRILVLDPRTGVELSRMEICDSPADLLWSPATRRVFASIPGCREISVVSPENAIDLGSIRLSGAPNRILMEPGTRRLLVTLPESNEVAICDLGSRQVVALVEVGRGPFSVVVP